MAVIVDVTLNIKKVKFSDKWKVATNAKGQPTGWYYRYEGGSDGEGNVVVNEENKKTKVRIKPTKSTMDDFWLVDVVPKAKGGAKNNDFTFIKSSSKRIAWVEDEATRPAWVEYCVVAQQKGVAEEIHCCPRISNEFNASQGPGKKVKVTRSAVQSAASKAKAGSKAGRKRPAGKRSAKKK